MRGRPPEILLATGNAGKLREIEQMTAHLGWIWRSLADFPDVPEAVEDGETFEDNARKKALFYSERTGRPALADDSGLDVDALGGAPGVHSAYYAGHPRDDAANNRKLVAALESVSPEERTARFRCVMAFAHAGSVLFTTNGTLEGSIELTGRGSNGFGYDPHFRVTEQERCLAELASGEKNAISHRGQALRAMLVKLQQHYGAAGGRAAWYRSGRDASKA